MNRAQVSRLYQVIRSAQPALPLYWEKGEPGPTADVTVTGHHGNDVAIQLDSYDDSLAVFPRDLYIAEDGTLYQWDDERAPGEEQVPVKLRWRYGTGDTAGDYRHSRYLDALEVTLDRDMAAVSEDQT